MTKRATKGEASKSAKADCAFASWLGVDASHLALARAGKLELPKWWEEFFGDIGDEPACADAYREARVFFELGEPESSKNAKSKRYGNLARIAAEDAVELSKIPKRRRKERREWIGQLSFFLSRVGVRLAITQGGHPRWMRLIDSGVVDFKTRSSGDGERIILTDKGRKFLARDRGDLGRAWSFCESACEWYLCAMVMRLRGIYEERSASRRRDVLAGMMAAESQLITAKKLGENLTEAQRATILERLKVIPVAKTERETNSLHSLLAKDAHVIRSASQR